MNSFNSRHESTELEANFESSQGQGWDWNQCHQEIVPPSLGQLMDTNTPDEASAYPSSTTIDIDLEIDNFVRSVFATSDVNLPNQPQSQFYDATTLQSMEILPPSLDSSENTSMTSPPFFGFQWNLVNPPNVSQFSSNPGSNHCSITFNTGSNEYSYSANSWTNDDIDMTSPGPSTRIDISLMTSSSGSKSKSKFVNEAMDQEVSMPSTSFDSDNSHYFKVDFRPVTPTTTADESMRPTEIQINSDPVDIAVEPVDIALPDPSENSIEEVKQLIETFNAGLLQWKRNEQLKEQDIRPDIEAFNQNLLNRLENLSDTIVENLILKRKQPKLRKLLEDFMQSLLVVTQQPARVNVYKTRIDSNLRILLSPKIFKDLELVNVVLWNQEKEDALNKPKDTDNYKDKKDKKHKKDKDKDKKLINPTDKKFCSIVENRIDLKLSIPENPARQETSDGTTVLDEFFWLNYEVKLHLRVKGVFNKSIPITLSATSFPIKVIVSRQSQEFRAWESVIWGNSAGQFDVYKITERKPTVPFISICKAINVWILRVTGRQLPDQDFRCVADLFKNSKFENGMTEEISFQEFRQEHYHEGLELEIPPRPKAPKSSKLISFWGWFWQLEKFISTHLQINDGKTNLWKDGKIMGYTISEEINKLLDEKLDPNLFILRFARKTPNGITVHRINYDKNKGIIPKMTYTGKDFTEQMRLHPALTSNDGWGKLYCPNGTTMSKQVIFQCDSPSQPAPTVPETNSSAGGPSRISIVMKHSRYVYPKIKVYFQSNRPSN